MRPSPDIHRYILQRITTFVQNFTSIYLFRATWLLAREHSRVFSSRVRINTFVSFHGKSNQGNKCNSFTFLKLVYVDFLTSDTDRKKEPNFLYIGSIIISNLMVGDIFNKNNYLLCYIASGTGTIVSFHLTVGHYSSSVLRVYIFTLHTQQQSMTDESLLHNLILNSSKHELSENTCWAFSAIVEYADAKRSLNVCCQVRKHLWTVKTLITIIAFWYV